MGIDRQGLNRPGKIVGRYRLLGLLGRGGMGEVWLGEDSQLQRQIAMKLLPAVLAHDREYLSTFRSEARTAAGLDHPHILPVHDFGEVSGEDEEEVVTYLVMPYIPGGTLSDRIHASHELLAREQVLHYLRQAAQAIDYAHNQHVLHRDIKPANLLLQDDWLWLADFGIAKLLTTTTYRSHTNAGSGTPEYMAPEQIQKVAEPASDRYSLGIVAYQLLTGQLPFRGETSYSVLIKQLSEPPPAPRAFNPQIPPAAEQVLLQALAKFPEERYSSCSLFVDALEHSWKLSALDIADPEATLLAPWRLPRSEMSRAPLTSRSQPETEQIEPGTETIVRTSQTAAETTIEDELQPVTKKLEKSLLRRRRAVFIGGAGVIAVLAGGIAFTPLLYTSWIKNRGSGPTPLPSFKPYPDPGPWQLSAGVPLLSLTGHTDFIYVASWDPTGRYLATGGNDTNLMLWDITTLLHQGSSSFLTISEPLRTWKFNYSLLSNNLAWSPDGRILAVAEGPTLLDPSNASAHGQQLDDVSLRNDVWQCECLAWQPGSDIVAGSISMDGTLQSPASIRIGLWRRDQPGKIEKFLNYTGPRYQYVQAHTLGWSRDGRWLATYLANSITDYTIGYTSQDNRIVIWEAATSQVKSTFQLPAPPTVVVPQHSVPLAWSPTEQTILALGNLANILIWDLQENRSLLTLSTSDTQGSSPLAVNITAFTWSPNGRYLAACYRPSRKIYIWDIQTLRQTIAVPNTAQNATLSFPQPHEAGHSTEITNLDWSPDGRYIASTALDKTVIVWNVDATPR